MHQLRWELLILLCFVLGWGASTVQAVPAFARREGESCQMCHFRMPEISADGDNYIRSGFREEAGDSEEHEEANTADQRIQRGEPVADIERPLGVPLPLLWADYLSMVGDHSVVVARGERLQFDAGDLDFWAAGPLDRHWSAMANPSFDIENGGVDVEQAYGQYITHWSDQFGSVRFGQLLPFAILFNQGGPPRMPLSKPVVLDTPADTGNPWTPDSLVSGLEVGGVHLDHWNAYLGVVNPNFNIGEEIPAPPTLDNTHIDFYGSGEYQFNDIGDSLTLYGYWGNATLARGEVGGFHRIGGFVNVYLPEDKITAGYLAGSDNAGADTTLDNSGYFFLIEHLLSERWAAYARYDNFRRDLLGGTAQTIQGPAVGLTVWAQTQVRLTAEAQFLNTTGEPAGQLFTGDFMWAF